VIDHRYKLLVVDIDGTLVGKDGNISPQDREALAKARDSGIKVSLSTGRAAQACLSLIDQLALDGYHIFFDGALVSNPVSNEEVYVQLLSKGVVRQAIKFAQLNDINIDLYSTTYYFIAQETWSSKVHHDFFSLQPILVDFDNIWQRERIIKLGLVATSPREAANAEKLYLRFKDSLHFSWVRTPAFPGVDFINVVAPGVSKGKALEALASHLGISLTEVIAIGDGANDISLLSLAGLGIAMGNAPAEVKTAADYTTLDIDRGGVAAAVNKFLL
jgi:Cof subfamily protein (haloacid dehalogenase superfamily)